MKEIDFLKVKDIETEEEYEFFFKILTKCLC